MSNKFKVGDKVRRICEDNHGTGFSIRVGDVLTVAEVTGTGELLFDLPGTRRKDTWSLAYYFELVEAAPTMAPDVQPTSLVQTFEQAAGIQPSGHLPDGSSVQKHSAGGLYPCVLVWRDKKASTGYDVGVIIPGHEPIWCRDLDAAVRLGQAWLDGRAA